MRLLKPLGISAVLIATAIVGGTLIGSALAAGDKTDADAAGALAIDAESAQEYCDVALDTFATELGVSRDAIVPAAKAAAIAAIDAAVANGDLDAERAEEIKTRISEADGEGCRLLGGWHGIAKGWAHGFGRGFLGADTIDAAAEALGLEGSADVIERMADGQSLEEIATELGVSYDDVKAAVLAEVQADLDAALAEGLDQERADRVLEHVTAWLDEGGEPRRFGHGFGRPGRGG